MRAQYFSSEVLVLRQFANALSPLVNGKILYLFFKLFIIISILFNLICLYFVLGFFFYVFVLYETFFNRVFLFFFYFFYNDDINSISAFRFLAIHTYIQCFCLNQTTGE